MTFPREYIVLCCTMSNTSLVPTEMDRHAQNGPCNFGCSSPARMLLYALVHDCVPGRPATIAPIYHRPQDATQEVGPSRTPRTTVARAACLQCQSGARPCPHAVFLASMQYGYRTECGIQHCASVLNYRSWSYVKSR